jgi:hypothetical protein
MPTRDRPEGLAKSSSAPLPFRVSECLKGVTNGQVVRQSEWDRQ